MTTNGWIKRIRSEKSRDLRKNYPNVLLLLDAVADHAKRTPFEGHPLLYIREAIITASICGLSSQEFETALRIASENKYITIIHSGRMDKDSILTKRPPPSPPIYPESHPESHPESKLILPRITSRINGTVVRLDNSDIYDINSEDTPNHIPNQNSFYPESHPESHPEQRRREALASLEEEPEEEEKENDDVRDDVVISITEGWKFLTAELKKCLDNVCYVVLEENKQLLDTKHLVSTLQTLGLSDSQIFELKDDFKFPVERIILAIAYVRSAHIHTSIMGTIIDHCQAEKPWHPKTKKQKLRRIPLDPIEASKASFGEGSVYIPKWMEENLQKTKAN